MTTQDIGKRSWVELDDNGNFYRCSMSRTNVGRADDLIASLAKEMPVNVRAISCPKEGVILNLAIKSGFYYIYGIVPHIILSGGWNVSAGILTPMFNAPAAVVTLSLKWVSPEATKIYFMVVADKPNSNYRFRSAYLVARSTSNAVGARGWRRLPLANIYPEGRVCLGNLNPKTDLSASGIWLANYDHFSKAVFNGDLADNAVGSDLLFRFNASDNKQMSVPEDWHRHCPAVNDSSLNMMSVQPE